MLSTKIHVLRGQIGREVNFYSPKKGRSSGYTDNALQTEENFSVPPEEHFIPPFLFLTLECMGYTVPEI